MRRTINPPASKPGCRSASLRILPLLLAALLLVLMNACASSPQNRMASPAPPANQNNLTPAAYVTLIRDDTAAEWEFVPWLRAAGARVDHDADGNDRIFNSPEARTVEVLHLEDGYLRSSHVQNNGTLTPKLFPQVSVEIAKIWPD